MNKKLVCAILTASLGLTGCGMFWTHEMSRYEDKPVVIKSLRTDYLNNKRFVVLDVLVKDETVVRYQPANYWEKCNFATGKAYMGYRENSAGILELLVLPNNPKGCTTKSKARVEKPKATEVESFFELE